MVLRKVEEGEERIKKFLRVVNPYADIKNAPHFFPVLQTRDPKSGVNEYLLK